MIDYHIRIQIAISLLCIAEAWLEEVVIRLKNPSSVNYILLNRQEHRRSAIYYGILVFTYFMIIWPYRYWYILLPGLILERRVFFEYALKIFRKKRPDVIEGDQYWDKISRGIFGRYGGWKELALLVIFIAGLNVLIDHLK